MIIDFLYLFIVTHALFHCKFSRSSPSFIFVDLEMTREKLRNLVEQGVPYDSQKMKNTYKEFKLDARWKELEKQHLELRDEIEQG